MENNVVLKEVHIDGNICGEFVEFSMNSVFENRGKNNIDAVYTFPIPDTAIITGFEIIIGGRTIVSQVEDIKEVNRIYDEAVEKEINTFALEEFKENVFRISIGQILAGATVKIKLSYLDHLIYEDDCMKLIIPAVVDPKRLSENTDIRNEPMDLSLIDEFEQEDDYKLSLNLLIEPLNKLDLKSPTHNINVEYDEDLNLYKVTFKDRDTYLDDEFVLILKEKMQQEASGMIYEYTEGEQQKGVLYLRLFPDLEEIDEENPKDYIFLIDISESMKGEKLEEAKNALKLCIRNLSDDDKFNIIAFENELKCFSKTGKVYFNHKNVEEASKWIDSLAAVDGTAIYEALKYALSEEVNGDNNTILLFTDDQIKQEHEILQYVKDNIKDNRLFTFGIETSENSFFINKLAEAGYGKPEFIYQDERIDIKVLRQFNRINNPQVDVLKIDWGNMKVERTYPRTIDYLYDMEPFSIFAAVSGEIEGNVTIEGKVGNKDYKKVVNLDRLDLEENADLVQKVWSRKRMESIAEKMKGEKGTVAQSMREKIIEISKESGIISSETSFILLEKVEDPLLGVSFTHIVPLKISERAMKSISEGYLLDTPSLLYKATGKARNTSIKTKKDTHIVLNRVEILRNIAKNQFADGSFSDSEESDVTKKIQVTLMAILAFSLGKEDLKIYSNQVNKAAGFVINTFNNNSEYFNEDLYSLTILSFKAFMVKGIVKGVVKGKIAQQIIEIIDKIKDLAQNNKLVNTLEVTELIEKESLREASVNIFDGSKENIQKLEDELTSLSEKDSISRLSLLGILKAL